MKPYLSKRAEEINAMNDDGKMNHIDNYAENVNPLESLSKTLGNSTIGSQTEEYPRHDDHTALPSEIQSEICNGTTTKSLSAVEPATNYNAPRPYPLLLSGMSPSGVPIPDPSLYMMPYSSTVLQEQLTDILNALQPEEPEATVHDEIYTYLNDMIDKQFMPRFVRSRSVYVLKEKDFDLKRFGSTISGFSLRNADLDFCLFMDLAPMQLLLEDDSFLAFDAAFPPLLSSFAPILPSSTPYYPMPVLPEHVAPPPGFSPSTPRPLAFSSSSVIHSSQGPLHFSNPLASRAVIELGSLLRQHPRVTDLKILPRARIPIIKFRDILSGLNCDIGVNNPLAIYNTALLRIYGQVDPRVTLLAKLVKFWSKKRSMNEPYLGTLSSYCWIVLVIYYLQHVAKPAILPPLQNLPPKTPAAENKFSGSHAANSSLEETLSAFEELDNADCEYISTVVDGYSVSFLKNVANLKDIWKNTTYIEHVSADLISDDSSLEAVTRKKPVTCSKYVANETGLMQLLQGFFKYYAYDFQYSTAVISIRQMEALTKQEKEWTVDKNSLKENYWLCVEDPFELSHNLARVVTRNR
jgi:hypothetical protein